MKNANASSTEYGMMALSIDSEAMYDFLIFYARVGEDSDSLMTILQAALFPDMCNLFLAANNISGEVYDFVSC